jgi:hypothetical protein
VNTARLLEKATSAGILLWIEGDHVRYRGERPALDELLPELRANKPALFAVLSGIEHRRQKVLAMFQTNPHLALALIADDRSEADAVLVTIGRKGADGCGYTADIAIDRARYDGVQLLELVEKCSGQSWPAYGGTA